MRSLISLKAAATSSRASCGGSSLASALETPSSSASRYCTQPPKAWSVTALGWVERLAGGVQIVDRYLFAQLQRAGGELFDRVHLAEAIGAGACQIGDELQAALRLGQMGYEAPHGVVGKFVYLGRDGDHPAAESVEGRVAGHVEVVPFTRFGVVDFVGAGQNVVALQTLDDGGVRRGRARDRIPVVGLGDASAVHGVERITVGEVGAAGRRPVLHLLGPFRQGAHEAGGC